MLGTSDRIAQTKQTIAASEHIARSVLVDMEMQRDQLKDTKSMVNQTSDFTLKTRDLLHQIVSKSNRKKV